MKWLCIFISTFVCFTTIPAFAGQTGKVTPVQEWQLSDAQQTFLHQLQHDTFNFFWETANPGNGLTPDRYPDPEFSSVAAVGFALSAYLVGVENHYISREQAARRTLTTLQFLREAPQSDAPRDVTGYKGFFYHFLYEAGRCDKSQGTYRPSMIQDCSHSFCLSLAVDSVDCTACRGYFGKNK